MKPPRLKISRYELPELIDAMRLQTAAEIGVHLGEFSYHLLKYSKLEKLTSIDSYRGRFLKYMPGAASLLAEFGGRSEFVQQSSMGFVSSRGSRRRRFDLVYIDAAHDKASVAADLAMWSRRVNSGGILAGHDYVDAPMCGVIEAVNEFAHKVGWQLFLTRERWASWLFFVP